MTIGGREVQEDFVGTLATQTGLVARPGGWDGESLWRTDRQPDGG